MKSVLIRLSIFSAAIVCCSSVRADWPQWRGPHRDGHAEDQALLQQWPNGGPGMAWEFDDAGGGYSSVAVAGGKLYTLGSDDSGCSLICVDVATGKRQWGERFSRGGNDDDYMHGWGGGPRSTPSVDGEQVFVLSDVGVLAAFSVEGGKPQWTRDLVQDFGGSIPKWGYSESPLVDGERVLVSPGGSNCVVGLDRSNGKKIWGSQGMDDEAHYVSIVKSQVGGTEFYVTAFANGLVGIDAKSGDVLFREPASANPVATIPTAIVHENMVYHTSDYGSGNQLLQLTAKDDGGLATELIYANSVKSMMNHHGGVVLHDGVIYGCSKTGRGVWMAQDFASGEVLWSEPAKPNASGSIAFADGRLYCYNDKEGSLDLVLPNRKGWKTVGKLIIPKQFEGKRGTNNKGAIWAHPVISDGKLFIRDQNFVFAYDIARP